MITHDFVFGMDVVFGIFVGISLSCLIRLAFIGTTMAFNSAIKKAIRDSEDTREREGR